MSYTSETHLNSAKETHALQALISAALNSHCRGKDMKNPALFSLRNPTSSPWSTVFSPSLFAGFIIMTSTLSSINYIRDIEIKIQEVWDGKQIKTHKEKKQTQR